jgi:MOSC domain-containing protein YiiM
VPSLRERLADVPQRGRVVWIGVRPAHRAPMVVVEQAVAVAGRGLEGDRVVAAANPGRRQVTLVQAEHLSVVAGFVGQPAIEPTAVRRNLVVAGVNLASLNGTRFAVGDDVVLVGTGPCAPCAKLDELVGPGAFQAMRGHGGLTAQVEAGGVIRVGDEVRVLGPAARPGGPE